jgi:hypothetical protein
MAAGAGSGAVYMDAAIQREFPRFLVNIQEKLMSVGGGLRFRADLTLEGADAIGVVEMELQTVLYLMADMNIERLASTISSVGAYVSAVYVSERTQLFVDNADIDGGTRVKNKEVVLSYFRRTRKLFESCGCNVDELILLGDVRIRRVLEGVERGDQVTEHTQWNMIFVRALVLVLRSLRAIGAWRRTDDCVRLLGVARECMRIWTGGWDVRQVCFLARSRGLDTGIQAGIGPLGFDLAVSIRGVQDLLKPETLEAVETLRRAAERARESAPAEDRDFRLALAMAKAREWNGTTQAPAAARLPWEVFGLIDSYAGHWTPNTWSKMQWEDA